MRTVGDISFERERLPLGVFEPNRGQIDGLPANPRKWMKAEDASAPEDGDEEEKEKKKAAVSQLLVCGVSVIGENGDCVLVREIPEAVADRLSAMGTEDLEKFGDAVLKCIADYDV